MPPRAILFAAALLAAPAAASEVETSAGPMRIAPVAVGFTEPWALDFLPGGAILVTERGGRLWLLQGAARQEIGGLPEIRAEGQGGLLDVMVPRDFAQSREIWLSFAAPGPEGAATAAGRGRLSDDSARLDGFETLFRGDDLPAARHFGARLVEAADGSILLTTGDRGTGPGGMAAQDPQSPTGKIIRLSRKGQPVPGPEGWRAGVFSLGHRNVQGAALDAGGRLLTVEHGARGGDEVNRVEAGRNYGWPVITYGRNYNFLPIGEGTEKPGLEQPLHYWDPSIAPSGLAIHSGALVPDWRGDLFTGSLNSDFISRLDPDTPAATGFAEERIKAPETGRVRDVAEGPDGALWFLSVTDGTLYRMAPAD